MDELREKKEETLRLAQVVVTQLEGLYGKEFEDERFLQLPIEVQEGLRTDIARFRATVEACENELEVEDFSAELDEWGDNKK